MTSRHVYISRRAFLRRASVVGTIALSGCTGLFSADPPPRKQPGTLVIENQDDTTHRVVVRATPIDSTSNADDPTILRPITGRFSIEPGERRIQTKFIDLSAVPMDAQVGFVVEARLDSGAADSFRAWYHKDEDVTGASIVVTAKTEGTIDLTVGNAG